MRSEVERPVAPRVERLDLLRGRRRRAQGRWQVHQRARRGGGGPPRTPVMQHDAQHRAGFAFPDRLLRPKFTHQFAALLQEAQRHLPIPPGLELQVQQQEGRVSTRPGRLAERDLPDLIAAAERELPRHPLHGHLAQRVELQSGDQLAPEGTVWPDQIALQHVPDRTAMAAQRLVDRVEREPGGGFRLGSVVRHDATVLGPRRRVLRPISRSRVRTSARARWTTRLLASRPAGSGRYRSPSTFSEGRPITARPPRTAIGRCMRRGCSARSFTTASTVL